MATKNEKATEEFIPSQIVFDYNGDTYTLAYDRASAEDAERYYDISPIGLRKMHMADMSGVLKGAFIKNHPDVADEAKETIISALGNRGELFGIVAKMYLECFQSLFEEQDEGKAIAWTAK